MCLPPAGMIARARSGNATVGVVLLCAAIAGASFPFFLTRTVPKVLPMTQIQQECSNGHSHVGKR